MHSRWLQLLVDGAVLGVGWWCRNPRPAPHAEQRSHRAERLSHRALRVLRRHQHDFQQWETELGDDPADTAGEEP